MNDKPSERTQEKRGCLSIGLALFGIVISVLYLANLTLGVWEIPDNLPVIGNLDEVFFSGVLFASLASLGISIPFITRHVPHERVEYRGPRREKNSADTREDD